MLLYYIFIALLLIKLPVSNESIFKKLKEFKFPTDKDTSLTSWGNIVITENEQVLLNNIKEIIQNYIKSNKIKKTDWLCNALDVDILRFLRLNINNNKSDDVALLTFNNLILHSKWRQSKYGIDNINKYGYDQMNYLNNYIYWLGQDIYGYPTLYIKSQLHDGKYYNEDPKLFTGYIVWILENGRKKFGVNKINIILDRSLPINNNNYSNDNYSNNNVFQEKHDVNVMKSLIELYRTLYSEIYPNYPDLLNEFKIFHTSWVFNICLAIVMKIFDEITRNKFKVYKNEKEIHNLMRKIFPNYILTNDKKNIKNDYDTDTSYSEIYYFFN